MPSTEQKNTLSILFILLVLALPFIFLYLSSTRTPQQTMESRAEYDLSSRPEKPMASPNQFILTRGKKILLDKIALTYRGIERKAIAVDLYLLEMDPEQPYRKHFQKKQARREMMLGGQRFKLVSASDNLLILRKEEKKRP